MEHPPAGRAGSGMRDLLSLDEISPSARDDGVECFLTAREDTRQGSGRPGCVGDTQSPQKMTQSIAKTKASKGDWRSLRFVAALREI